ncbi:ABC transporter ATP-binding protein [Lactiplantibacillus modestisalitolerans]|uniref:ABC transporter ATP-binding protein n=1 Tax=Lactiplantibacillus modestisalitolerans TaxID=1457219 RepID=A0ABV5WSD6_9LACO|nr:ABC transporter ATP-binding protein [Lactiplantibacillus modestisalitolerans]
MEVNLKHLNLTYPGQQPLFQNLTCTLADGELVALVGPSGSGKTTLLNVLAGILTPDAGQVVFDGTDVTRATLQRRNIGMVFQDYALYPHLSVLDNIAFPLKMAHVKKRLRYQRARQLAELVAITPQLAKYPAQLSGGQQQRVALARALIKQPAVLLLDEPLSNLDANLRVALRTMIRRIQRQTHVTTVFVTHDQNDALQIADRIIVLNHGKIQQMATTTELYQRPQNQFVAQFIGQPRINLIPMTAVRPYFAVQLAPTLLANAVTVGIRPEALESATTTATTLAQLPVRLVAQWSVGKEQLTTVQFAQTTLISTAVPATTQPLTTTLAVRANGCYFFDAEGNRLEMGVPHA